MFAGAGLNKAQKARREKSEANKIRKRKAGKVEKVEKRYVTSRVISICKTSLVLVSRK